VSSSGAAVALVGLALTAGCGRIGFGSDDSGRDGSTTSDDGAACVATSVPISATPARSEFPVLAWNGTKAGISWIEDPTGTPSGHFRTASLEGPAEPMLTLGVPGPTDDLAVVWGGASWRLSWSENSGQGRAILRSTDGSPGQAITTNVRTNLEARMAPLSADTTAYLWVTNGPNAGFDLILAVLNASGTRIVNDQTITTGLNAIDIHAIAWTGSELVVFYATTTQLLMLRLTASGTPIAGPVPIATETVSSHLWAHWTGDRFLVTWYSGSSIHVAYVSPVGALIMPVLHPPAGAVLSLGVSSAVGPTSDVVVWDDIGTGSAYLLPVARDGSPGTRITFPQAGSITAAWVGTTWAVAIAEGPMQRDIYLHQLCL
jgi:hypothetical protein